MRNFLSNTWLWLTSHKAEWITVVCILLLDRVSKRLALTFLDGYDMVLLPYLHLNYVQNTGAAFGMMQGGNLILIFITLLIMGYMIKNWKELCSYGLLVKWGLLFILGGALGNLYDRITLGFVVDFIDLRVWPVFNVADSFITIGGVLLACAALFKPGKKIQQEGK